MTSGLVLVLCCSSGVAHGDGSIHGRIRAGGSPVGHANVLVAGLGPGVQSDAYGDYKFDRVPAGKRVVRVQLGGYAPTIDSTTVIDGRSVTLNFALVPDDSVEVQGLRPKGLEPPKDWHPPAPPDSALLERMRRATDVRLVRLTGRWNGEREWPFDTNENYRLVWMRKLTDRSLRSRLLDLLARPESFDHGHGWGQKKCAPSPGVAVRFLDRAGEVDLMLCYECEVLWITAGSTRLAGDFDRTAAEFTRWVKDAIPDDPAIQALREHGPDPIAAP